MREINQKCFKRCEWIIESDWIRIVFVYIVKMVRLLCRIRPSRRIRCSRWIHQSSTW